MRHRILMFVLGAWLGAWSSPAASESYEDGPPPPALLDDPSLATSIYFPPATTTAGVAVVGPRSTGRIRILPCTSANPCALVTPAADSARPTR